MTSPDHHKPPLPTTTRPRNTHRCRNTILAVAASLLALSLLALTLALTAFRPKQSITTVQSIKLDGIKAGFNPSGLGLDLNITVLLGLSVTNPNRASFRFSEGSSQLFYRGSLVGEASVPPGDIGSHGTIDTVARLVIMATRLAASSDAYSDFLSGTLNVTSYTRIPGRVNVMGIFKHRMVMYTTCDVAIDTMTRKVAGSNCWSRTKL